MRDSDYYPAGAYNDPNAPYNEPSEPEPICVKVWVNINLIREAEVDTTNYSEERDEEFGGSDIELHDHTSDILGYYQAQHHSIPALLNELAKYIKGELLSEGISHSRKQELKAMLADCEGWDEEVTIEDYGSA